MTSDLTSAVGFVPLAFVGVIVLAALGDLGLYRSRTGLALRAVGLDETSSRRLGMSTGRTIVLAFVVCSVLATLGGFYLAAEVQVGSPIIGNQALESIAAAVLGGASLAGGRGSFVGTLLAAFFLTEINNVLPLFQQPTEYADMTIGALILLALLLYQSPVLIARFRRLATHDRAGGGACRLGRSAMSPASPRIGRAADDDPDRLDGLVADRPETVRRRGVEGDRRARPELVLVEADAHAEGAAGDVPVLAAAVRDERIVRAGLGADGIDDVRGTRPRGRCAASGAPSARRTRGSPRGACPDARRGRRSSCRARTARGVCCVASPKTSPIVIPSSVTSAYSVLTDGLTRSSSICDTRLGDTPTRRASSRRLILRRSRSSRSRLPTLEGSKVRSVAATSLP